MRFILRWELLGAGLLLLGLSLGLASLRAQPSTAWQIIFWQDNDIYQVNITGNNFTKFDIITDPGYSLPRWSDDHQWIIYDNLAGEIYQIKADGTGAQQLTFPPDGKRDLNPHWSPSHQQYLFTREQLVNIRRVTALYVSAQDQLETITDDDIKDVHGTEWSPRGDKILFEGYTDVDYSFYVYDLASQQVIELTANHPFDYKSYPSWSPDGERIVFAGDTGEVGSLVRVYSIRPDGSALEVVTPPDFDVLIHEALWSPTDEWIAVLSEDYKHNAELRFDLFSSDSQSRKTFYLNDIRIHELEWGWSPDGRWLIFNDNRGYIYRLDVRSGEIKPLAQDETRYFYYPQTSYALDMTWHAQYLYGIAGLLLLGGSGISFLGRRHI